MKKFEFVISGYNTNSNALKLLEYSDDSIRQLDAMKLDNPSFVTNYKKTIFTYSKNPLKLICINCSGNVVDKLFICDEIKLDLKSMTHLSFSRVNETLYGASYLDGCIVAVKYKDNKFGQIKIINHKELYSQDSKCHAIILNEDENIVCCVNIATSCLYFYDVDLNYIDRIQLKEGCGPRHACFSGKMIYCITEYSNEVVAINLNTKEIRYYSSIHSECESYGATLFIKSNYLFASNRGEETIAKFKIDKEGWLEYQESFSVYGYHSRHMINYDDLIITCNKNSNNICFIDINTHKLVKEIKIPNPSGVCVLSD